MYKIASQMNHNFDTITESINIWLKTVLLDNKITEIDHNGANSQLEILRLENWLYNWKKENGINLVANPALFSEHLFKNSLKRNYTFLKPLDYQLHFLNHLALNRNDNPPLFSIISKFVEKHLSELSLYDIEITSTGATRCHTNIRFCLGQLRNLGFIAKDSKESKDKFKPSIIGLVILFLIYKENIKMDDLSLRNRSLMDENLKYSMDSGIMQEIIRLQFIKLGNDNFLYEFLNYLESLNLDKTNRKFIEEKIKNYYEFITEFLEIKEFGIQETKEYEKKAKLFLNGFLDPTLENEKARYVLLDIYQNCF